MKLYNIILALLVQISDMMAYFVPGSSFYFPIFLFGESYGATYAVAVAKKIQDYKKAGYIEMDELDVRGIGLGNG